MSDEGRPAAAPEATAPARAAVTEAWNDPRFLPWLGPAAAFLALFCAGLAWHAMLPSWEQFEGVGSVLMGPLPAAFGVPVGLRLHRREAAWFRLLAAAAWGFLGCLAALLALGPFTVGLWATARGLYATFQVPLFNPFSGLPYLGDHFLTVPALWSLAKDALSWAAFAYGGIMAWRHDALAFALPLFGRHATSWAVNRHLRGVRAQWNADYLVAVRAGLPTPPVPPELTAAHDVRPLGQVLATGLTLARIVLLIAGVLGLWAAFDDQVKAVAGMILFSGLRQLFGG